MSSAKCQNHEVLFLRHNFSHTLFENMFDQYRENKGAVTEGGYWSGYPIPRKIPIPGIKNPEEIRDFRDFSIWLKKSRFWILEKFHPKANSGYNGLKVNEGFPD